MSRQLAIRLQKMLWLCVTVLFVTCVMDGRPYNFPRDASFTTKLQKTRALAAYRASIQARDNTTAVNQRAEAPTGMTAEQNLLTKQGTCNCACNPAGTCAPTSPAPTCGCSS